jgi:hypothetical protein
MSRAYDGLLIPNADPGVPSAPIRRGCRCADDFRQSPWLGETMALPRRAINPASVSLYKQRALAALQPLTARSTTVDLPTALAIMRYICRFHLVPLRLGWTILEHECSGNLGKCFRHRDGVMQTISTARASVIPRMPRALKLTLVGLSLSDPISNVNLDRRVLAEFSRRLAVQIATGVQELKEGLDRFSGYVALAFVAYNAGAGSATHIVTRGKAKTRPRGINNFTWANMCRMAAAMLHQLPAAVRVEQGVWRCDKNIPAWFREIRVRDPRTNLLLIAYQYLRSVRECILKNKPAVPCNAASHGVRQPGTGSLNCGNSRAGALDKLYNPTLLRPSFFNAAQGLLPSIQQDTVPLKVLSNGQLVKRQLTAPVP